MQKSGFPKMRHYVGFSQIGSHIAAAVSIFCRQGLRIDVHHKNQPNKSKLLLYKQLFLL